MSDIWYSVSQPPHTRPCRRHESREATERGALLIVSPLMDMVELPEGLCVYCDLPGAAPGEIALTVTGRSLHVRAESRLPPIRGKVRALEFNDIVYEGTIELPFVATERVEAFCSDGLLRVTIYFPPVAEPVRIPVTTR